MVSGACYSVRRKKVKITVTFVRRSKIAKRYDRRSKIAERSKHREHREAMRSKIAKRCYRSIAKRCSRGIADDDAPGGVSVGAKRRSPPRASSSSDCRCPPSLLQLPSRVSIYLYLNKISRTGIIFPRISFLCISVFFV